MSTKKNQIVMLLGKHPGKTSQEIAALADCSATYVRTIRLKVPELSYTQTTKADRVREALRLSPRDSTRKIAKRVGCTENYVSILRSAFAKATRGRSTKERTSKRERAILAMQQFPKEKNAQIARIVGCSPSYVSSLRNLLSKPEIDPRKHAKLPAPGPLRSVHPSWNGWRAVGQGDTGQPHWLNTVVPLAPVNVGEIRRAPVLATSPQMTQALDILLHWKEVCLSDDQGCGGDSCVKCMGFDGTYQEFRVSLSHLCDLKIASGGLSEGEFRVTLNRKLDESFPEEDPAIRALRKAMVLGTSETALQAVAADRECLWLYTLLVNGLYRSSTWEALRGSRWSILYGRYINPPGGGSLFQALKRRGYFSSAAKPEAEPEAEAQPEPEAEPEALVTFGDIYESLQLALVGLREATEELAKSKANVEDAQRFQDARAAQVTRLTEMLQKSLAVA